MSKFSEFKVGLFLLICILILIFMSFKVGGLSFLKSKKGYIIYSYFKSVAGLEKGSPVRVAGLYAGFVEDIYLVEDKVKVAMRIKPNIKLRKGTKAYLRSMGLIGEKYIELSLGEKGAEEIKEKDVIPAAEEYIDIDQLISRLAKVSESVKSDLREFLKNLNRIILKNENKISKTFDNFEFLSCKLREDLPNLITELNKMISENRGNLKDIIKNIDESSNKLKLTIDSANKFLYLLNRITTEIDEGKGILGKLMKEERIYKKKK